MATMDDGVLEEWLKGLKDLDIQVKKMFGCYCVYCDAQPVGWLSGEVFSLKEVGFQIMPKKL